MKTNTGICCNVCECRYNVDARKCELDEVQIANGNKQCTCCASFEEK